MRSVAVLIAVMAFSSSVDAEPRGKLSQGYRLDVARVIAKIAARPDLVALIEKHNATTTSFTREKILSLDKRWRAGEAKVIDPVVNNALSRFLKAEIDSSNGGYSEIIVMGKKGLAIGVSPKTTDFWQGDEAKWLETYLKGAHGFHAGRYELDRSTNTWGSQISQTLVINNQTVGAITIGINIVHRSSN